MMRILVDGANVVGSRPNGWWRDRAGAARALVATLSALADEHEVTIVLEGQARGGVAAGVHEGVAVVHAPGSGDDTLAQLAEEADVLVTADRGLRARVQCRCEGPRWLEAQQGDPRS